MAQYNYRINLILDWLWISNYSSKQSYQMKYWPIIEQKFETAIGSNQDLESLKLKLQSKKSYSLHQL